MQQTKLNMASPTAGDVDREGESIPAGRDGSDCTPVSSRPGAGGGGAAQRLVVARGVLGAQRVTPVAGLVAQDQGESLDAVLGSVRKVVERRSGEAKTGEEAEFTCCK